jgi:hypothetical protein
MFNKVETSSPEQAASGYPAKPTQEDLVVPITPDNIEKESDLDEGTHKL